MKKNKGFTLAELLVVVAIIAVLVAITIPIFSTKLHDAKVATDWANLRTFYTEIRTDEIETGDLSFLNDYPISYTLIYVCDKNCPKHKVTITKFPNRNIDTVKWGTN